MFFDDDLLDGQGGAEGADVSDVETLSLTGEGSGAASNDTVQTLEVSSAPRRKRGSRGGAASTPGGGGKDNQEKRWRFGAIPTAHSFDGDIDIKEC